MTITELIAKRRELKKQLKELLLVKIKDRELIAEVSDELQDVRVEIERMYNRGEAERPSDDEVIAESIAGG